MPSREISQPGGRKSGPSARRASTPSSHSEGRSGGPGKHESSAKDLKPDRRVQSHTAVAVVSRRAADRLRGGHVWVYRSDLEKIAPPQADSRLMTVLDPRGHLLGTALYSGTSQIALRMIGPGEIDEAGWLALLRERLKTAIRFRKKLLEAEAERTDSCRLVFSEADFLPGLIADKYGELVVLQVLTQGMDSAAVRSVFLDVAKAEIAPAAVFERSDPRIREIEELSAPNGPLYVREGVEPSAPTIFRLNGLSFHFDAQSGQKTGAFLDQRENYAAAARHCRGEALDVCAYQGGFALHLARSCTRVTGVDASRVALEVAERNLELNRDSVGAIEVDWVEANAFDLLRDWSDTGVKFDSIVLDPPAFTKSKRAAQGALRGYKELNLRAIKMLRPGGTLVTCSCSHHVALEAFSDIVAAAARDAHRRLRLLERRGAAPDHPVLLNVPETEYLKCLICWVE